MGSFRRLLLVAVMLLCCVAPVFAAQSDADKIRILGFEEGSINFSFSRAYFTEYQGKRALVIDVEAVTVSTLLAKDVSFANFELLFYAKDGRTLTPDNVKPLLLDSNNLGTIVGLDPSGPILRQNYTTIPDKIKGVNLPKGAVHTGSLLFIVPDNAVLIHGLRYYGTTTTVRMIPNRYIELPSLDEDSIFNEISVQDVPTQLHMYLLQIYLDMQEFKRLNERIKSERFN